MSNYEITKRRMAEEFLKYDQDAMLRKFSLDSDSDYLYIDFLARRYRIGRRDGVVERLERGGGTSEADYNEAMTLYDLLCQGKEHCRLSGQYVPFQKLAQVVMGAVSAPGADMFQSGLQVFDHRDGELRRACERLGGVPEGRGDVSYRIPMFDFFPVVFQFWDSDDEFPASMSLLFDRNALDYMHYETTWYAASQLLSRLREEMDDTP